MALQPSWSFFDERLGWADELFRALTPPAASRGLRGAGVVPAINLYDDGQAFVVRAEIPGVRKELV